MSKSRTKVKSAVRVKSKVKKIKPVHHKTVKKVSRHVKVVPKKVVLKKSRPVIRGKKVKAKAVLPQKFLPPSPAEVAALIKKARARGFIT